MVKTQKRKRKIMKKKGGYTAQQMNFQRIKTEKAQKRAEACERREKELQVALASASTGKQLPTELEKNIASFMGGRRKTRKRKRKTKRRKRRKRKTKRRKRRTRRRKMKGGGYECLDCLNEVRELIRTSDEIRNEILRYYGKKDVGTNILKVIKRMDNLVNKKLYPLLLVLQDSEKCRECFEKQPRFNMSEFNELLGLILGILEKGEIYNEKEEKYVKLSENTQGLVYLMRQTMILLNATEKHIRKKINVKDMLRKRMEDRKKLLSSPLERPESPIIDEILKNEGSLKNLDKNPKIKKMLDEEMKKMKLSMSPIRIPSSDTPSSATASSATASTEESKPQTPPTPQGMFKPIDTDSDSN